MVPAAVHRRSQGIVPFDPFRHLGQVVDLVAESFADEMGPVARHVLRRLRRLARWGGLGLLFWQADAGILGPPGFVWLEDGRVVGNVSLRRAASHGGWMIGNVAVDPQWRGRGIGRALLETAIQAAAQRGGLWVGLEVREDNPVALRLYEGLGFRVVGSSIELIRPAGLPWPHDPPLPPPARMRRATAGDSATLYQLAQTGLSRPHRDLLEVRPSAYRAGWEARVNGWLEGCSDHWWITREGGQSVGAVGLRSRWTARYHWCEVLCPPERLADLGPALVAALARTLSRRRPWETVAVLPGPRQALEPSFHALGFRRLRRLLQMQRLLGQEVRIRP